MADNIATRDATGATVTVATDEVSTIHYQRFKPTVGPANAAPVDVALGAGMPVRDDVFTPVGAHTSNATLTSAVTLTPPTGATKLLIQIFTANVRYRLDGTNPTASVGFRWAAGDSVVLSVNSAVRIIQESAGAGVEYQWGS